MCSGNATVGSNPTLSANSSELSATNSEGSFTEPFDAFGRPYGGADSSAAPAQLRVLPVVATVSLRIRRLLGAHGTRRHVVIRIVVWQNAVGSGDVDNALPDVIDEMAAFRPRWADAVVRVELGPFAPARADDGGLGWAID